MTHRERALACPNCKPRDRWHLDLGRDAPEMVCVAAQDLRRFLAEGFGVRLASAGRAEGRLRVRSEASPGGAASKREHRIHVTPGGIEIVGATEWGAACGLYHLQRRLSLSRAPRLPLGILRSEPTLDPSLTYPAFQRGGPYLSELDYPAAYHPPIWSGWRVPGIRGCTSC